MIRSKFFKNVLLLASGTIIGQLIIILTSPLLTRLYSPDEFGILAIYTSILNIIVIVSSLRYELAIPLPKKESQAKVIFSMTFQINIIASIIVLILGLSLSESISNWTNSPEIKNYLWLLSIGVLLLGTYKALNYWAIRQRKYKIITKTKILQSLTSTVTQVLSGIFGVGAIGLIIGQILGQSTGITSLSRKSGLGKSIFKIKKDLSEKTRLLKEHRAFALLDTPASLLNVVSLELPQILFASAFSPKIAGYYLLSQKVLGAPLRVIGQSISHVLYGDISEHLKNGVLSKITIKIIMILAGITIIPTIVLYFFGADLFVLIFGQQWYEAGRFASFLIFGMAARFVYSPISLILLATKGQKINFILQLIMVIFNLNAIYLGWVYNDPFIAVIGISLGSGIIYLIGIIVIYFRTNKLEKICFF